MDFKKTNAEPSTVTRDIRMFDEPTGNLDTTTGDTQFHLVKYEMIKMMIETIITESESVDEKLGTNNSELTIPFKIAFNTLRVKNIINKL